MQKYKMRLTLQNTCKIFTKSIQNQYKVSFRRTKLDSLFKQLIPTPFAMFLILYLTFSALLAILYTYIMARTIFFWHELPEWVLPQPFVPHTKITVLIAARNEAEHIESCLKAVAQQNYPPSLFEIIVIDDHSDDGTPQRVQQLAIPNLRLLTLRDFLEKKPEKITSFKKKALEIGIAHANGNWIVCTDADCTMGENWLSLIVSFLEKKQLQFVAAPVCFHQEKSTFERFQSLDFVGMMGVTGAGIEGQFMNMCNGANLAYSKAAFEAVGGFSGIDKLASGDDMLLLQKIARRFPEQVGFLKNRAAATFTFAMPTVGAFLQQRIRWASKSSSYDEKQVTAMLIAVFLLCGNIFLSLALSMFFAPIFVAFLLQLIAKLIMDFYFLHQMCRYFRRSDLMRTFGLSFVMHTAYIFTVGALANFSSHYEWKGRRVQ